MKTEHRLYSRAEVRNVLRDLANQEENWLVHYRDAFRNDPKHIEKDCLVCKDRKSRQEAFEWGRRIFGGR